GLSVLLHRDQWIRRAVPRLVDALGRRTWRAAGSAFYGDRVGVSSGGLQLLEFGNAMVFGHCLSLELSPVFSGPLLVVGGRHDIRRLGPHPLRPHSPACDI